MVQFILVFEAGGKRGHDPLLFCLLYSLFFMLLCILSSLSLAILFHWGSTTQHGFVAATGRGRVQFDCVSHRHECIYYVQTCVCLCINHLSAVVWAFVFLGMSLTVVIPHSVFLRLCKAHHKIPRNGLTPCPVPFQFYFL